MFARVVYGRLRQVSPQERAEVYQRALSAVSRQPGFVAAYYLTPSEEEDGVLSVSLWESKEAALQAAADRGVQGAHLPFSTLLAAPPQNRIVEVEAESQAASV